MSRWAGVCQLSVLRGRVLSSAATAARSAGYDVLHIRDNDTGEVRKIAIDVVPAHTCRSSGWTVDVAPAEGRQGYRSQYCDTCGDTIAMELLTDCGSHTFGDWILEKEAGAETMGIRYHECRNCGARETEYLEAVGVRGDVNGDKVADYQDAIYLIWHTLFPEMYPLSGNGDLNDDNEINDADAVILLWYALFPEKVTM